MKTATLYIRVSTDEQALKGYSQHNQRDHLLQYCNERNIEVLQTIFEDHSARTFDRPEWSSLLKQLRQTKLTRPDLILFTRWDRFSRNSGDAYFMISELKRLKIETQAIEQPLNLLIPENKMILALYLATSEVENDRRALNIKQGIHKAKQEGRWTGRAPLGYINRTLDTGRKCIVPHEPEAGIIRSLFIQMSNGKFSIRQMHRLAIANGLKCSVNNFWCLIRNPVYCGKITVPEFENEKHYLVQGAHEQLVSEKLFLQVQQELYALKRKPIVRRPVSDKFPFRGILQCPLCNKMLRGSTSKGKYNYYSYYHCSLGCKFRVRSDQVNQQFISEIKKLVPERVYVDLLKIILYGLNNKQFETGALDQGRLTRDIERLLDRSIKARELLTIGEIDTDDYSAIKADCKRKINLLGIGLQHAAEMVVNGRKNIDKKAKILSQLSVSYEGADIETKRKIIKLLLGDKAAFPATDFISMLNRPASIVFGFYKESMLPDDGHLTQEASPHWNAEVQNLYDELLKWPSFRAKKKSSIPIEQFAVIVGFLKPIAETAF
jgi:DNA invertase Pin-like site-specific DNA recombinase